LINNLDSGNSSDQPQQFTSTPFKPTQIPSQLAVQTGGPVSGFVRGRVDLYVSSIDRPLDAYTPSEAEVDLIVFSDHEIEE
jgi:hypothetical protein